MTRIACCQMAPVIADLRANLELIDQQIRQAVAQGAQVVVLPELATSGYVLADEAEARSLALTRESPEFGRWAEAAQDAVIVLGYCELGDDDRLYNSAVLLDSSGVLGHYRKTHLWDQEKLIFASGDELPSVVETKHGAIAVMICYDLEFSEVTRLVATQGAELIAAPVNWPSWPRPEGERGGELITAMSTARVNKVAVAVCDRTGAERGVDWTEGTSVITPDGWIVAGVGTGEGMAVADVDLAATRDKSMGMQADLLGDRRLDLY